MPAVAACYRQAQQAASWLQLGAQHVFLSGDRAFKRVGGLNVKVFT